MALLIWSVIIRTAGHNLLHININEFVDNFIDIISAMCYLLDVK
jgi:hypothetical protein